MKNNEIPGRTRKAKSGLMGLAAAASAFIVVGGAFITIAAAPVLIGSVAGRGSETAGLSRLMITPSFRAPERAQSDKSARLVAARSGQDRVGGLTADEIRTSALEKQLAQFGQIALANHQRDAINKQVEENGAAVQLALASPPPELQTRSTTSRTIAESRPAAAPAAKAEPETAATALVASADTGTDAGNAFKLVLQGADKNRMAPGEVPVPEPRPAGTALAYAALKTDSLGTLFNAVPETTTKVAVYDISTAKVYMPDGTVLEAHSGRGKYRDNPDYTHLKMAGAVPAATYKLTLRESLFHGVQALRMTSVDGTDPLGRTGLLAHTYMLSTPGDSHGCLVFKNYNKFLEAFRKNEVDYIVAVPSLQKSMLAQLNRRTV
ncbi:DUF2778 domain-containing protein [Martelella sp. HB161492]|uniref:DUF2778 domain-containing protein n=1 Tax=Martelella sp. HB161492 TaxID=2720726 RepID=UPI001AEDB3AA|nr:DUF2778 domain-containing protein [Martelella sp. HB161492]